MILYNRVCCAFEYALLVGGRGTSRPGKSVRSTYVALRYHDFQRHGELYLGYIFSMHSQQ